MKTNLLTTILIVVPFFVNYISAQLPQYLSSNGIVAWYDFNGNANDMSANSLHGTPSGIAPTTDRFGQDNQAYSFNGNASISLGNSELLNLYKSFTVAGWFYPTSANQYQALVCREGSGISQTPWLIRLNTGKVSLWLGNGSSITEFFPNEEITYNNWQHFAVQFDSLTQMVRIYINGELSLDTITNQKCLNYQPVVTKIGKQNNNNFPFSGKIDDIGIWSRVLSKNEVLSLYHAGLCYHSESVTDTLIINWTVNSFNPVKYKNIIKIWPNPTNSQLQIENINSDNYDIEITNFLGQTLYRETLVQQYSFVDMSIFTDGIYTVRIISTNGKIIDSKKIVLQH